MQNNLDPAILDRKENFSAISKWGTSLPSLPHSARSPCTVFAFTSCTIPPGKLYAAYQGNYIELDIKGITYNFIHQSNYIDIWILLLCEYATVSRIAFEFKTFQIFYELELVKMFRCGLLKTFSDDKMHNFLRQSKETLARTSLTSPTKVDCLNCYRFETCVCKS